jgi:PAS domain S-box-containing protein
MRHLEELELLFDLSLDLLCVAGFDGRFKMLNPAWTNVLDFPIEELLSHPFIDFVHPDDRERTLAETGRLRTDRRTHEFENRCRRKDGSYRWLLWKAASSVDREKIYAVVRDVTEIKHVDSELRQVHQELEDSHAQLQKQLFRAQRMESIGMLASGIAHDLNNILAPILMGIQLFKDKLKDQASRQTLATLELSATRGANLVKQVLTFTRGLEGERMRVQVRHVLRDIEKIAHQTFPKSIHINTDIPRNLPSVSADATQLHQVVMNLCVNSRDAMPNGGALSISAEDATLGENSLSKPPDAKAGRYVVMQVTDTGTGIPAVIIDEIFKPFFTTKEIGLGTGLGLSTVQAIVKNHGGFVTVRSEVGKGTTFRVHLPAIGAAEAENARTLSPNLPAGNGELILIVDDEAAVRDIARMTLESYGYRVLVAANGVEGVAVYSTHATDIEVVISDMNMPVMSGSSMIDALRAINSDVKILLSSGLVVQGGIAKRAEETGAAGYISKPYTAQQLLQKLDEILKQ